MEYTELESTLECGSGACRTEHWHGLLCGLLSVGRPASVDLMHRLLFEVTGLEGELRSDQYDALAQLLLITRQQFAKNEIEFDLLLPDDEQSLVERTQALGGWCETYLYGLSAGGLSDDTEVSDEVAEFITDLTEISRAEYGLGASEDEDEFRFNELVEYIRVGVLLVNENLNPVGIDQQNEH